MEGVKRRFLDSSFDHLGIAFVSDYTTTDGLLRNKIDWF